MKYVSLKSPLIAEFVSLTNKQQFTVVVFFKYQILEEQVMTYGQCAFIVNGEWNTNEQQFHN